MGTWRHWRFRRVGCARARRSSGSWRICWPALPEFREAYNESLREYRQWHRVRSISHPAPDLAEEGPGWKPRSGFGPPKTRAAAGCSPEDAAGETLLSDRQSWEARLPLHAEGDAGQAVERLMELQRGGVRIRPRALVDHPLGKAGPGRSVHPRHRRRKYDCVTDRLIERFFGLAAPRFLVVSATLHLPIDRDRATPDDVRRSNTICEP